MPFSPLWVSPADFGSAMPHGARACTWNSLELFDGNHHHGHDAVATGSAEVGREIRSEFEIRFVGQSIGAFQNDVASRTLLGVKPEITIACLPKTDPVVLAVVAPHLHFQLPGRG